MLGSEDGSIEYCEVGLYVGIDDGKSLGPAEDKREGCRDDLSEGSVL